MSSHRRNRPPEASGFSGTAGMANVSVVCNERACRGSSGARIERIRPPGRSRRITDLPRLMLRPSGRDLLDALLEGIGG
jgi:hypothetical protein